MLKGEPNIALLLEQSMRVSFPESGVSVAVCVCADQTRDGVEEDAPPSHGIHSRSTLHCVLIWRGKFQLVHNVTRGLRDKGMQVLTYNNVAAKTCAAAEKVFPSHDARRTGVDPSTRRSVK